MALGVGALALLVSGADHLEEYTANHFSTVPTIGPLFLLNFIAATAVAVALPLPVGPVTTRRAELFRVLLATIGIGIATTSLVALEISEHSSLFGFTDHGYRPAIIVAIVSEAVTVIALGAFLALTRVGLRHPSRGISAYHG